MNQVSPMEALSSERTRFESYLKDTTAAFATVQTPEHLAEAMGYSIFAGGKRLRPLLSLAGARAVGASFDNGADASLPVAVALECIHTYSLIHDDLPAMDDDDLRRGKPTSHKVYGEAMAILTGDALLTRAFEVLSAPAFVDAVGPATAIRLVREVAAAAGAAGMVGGQVLDIDATGKSLDIDALSRLHAAKTGALIRVAVVGGAMAAGASESQLDALRTYGDALGLCFQIVDDVLDVTSDTDVLGKPSGSDARNGKRTFVDLLGLEGARDYARRVGAAAHQALDPLGDSAAALASLVDYVQERVN